MKKKKLLWIILGLVFALWVGYRIYAIAAESRRIVFNSARVESLPVTTIVLSSGQNTLREPLYIKNNKAYVSAARAKKFGSGQKIENGGSVRSVSNKIDLDSGMYIIRTNGAVDGENFALSKYTGFMVPLYAVRGNSVMIMEDGLAKEHAVKIINQDSENAIVMGDINDNDVLILSRVTHEQPVSSD